MHKTNNGVVGFAVAPMLDWTDKHCRVFYRLMSNQAWLYSEMVTTGAILYGKNLPRFLGRDDSTEFSDQPVVLQLGGSSPEDLAKCAKLAVEFGYDAVNLNVGCPSDRVQNNLMGACLMAHPDLVADCVAAMKDAVDIPITVKHRIGIDEQESFDILQDFVGKIKTAGTDGVIIHARKAWLQGLSPKQNREIPPLNYDWVHQIKQVFPDLPVMINGGIATPSEGLAHLPAVDGVMLGRAIYENPYLLAEVDALYYRDTAAKPDRFGVLELLYPYIEAHLRQGGKLNHIARHLFGLFYAQPGGRLWRRFLTQQMFEENAGIEVLQQGAELVKAELVKAQNDPKSPFYLGF